MMTRALATVLSPDLLDSVDAVVLFTARSAGVKVFRRVRELRPDILMLGSDSLLNAPFVEKVNNITHRLKQPDAQLLVASPFFYELAPLKSRHFRRLLDKRLTEHTRGRTEESKEPKIRRSIAPYPALFADAALLVTRGIMAGLANGKKTVEELRNEVFTHLDGIDSPERAVGRRYPAGYSLTRTGMCPETPYSVG